MDTKEQEQVFIKGFNQGYYMSRYEPGALNDILKVENEWNVFIRGMKAGHEEHFKEVGKEEIKKAEPAKEADFKKGFNMGYFFSKYEAGTGDKQAKMLFDKVDLPGFKEGAKHFKQEQFENRLPSFMREPQPDKDDHVQPDKDDLEPEK